MKYNCLQYLFLLVMSFKLYRFYFATFKGINYLLISFFKTAVLLEITITSKVGKPINTKHTIN